MNARSRRVLTLASALLLAGSLLLPAVALAGTGMGSGGNMGAGMGMGSSGAAAPSTGEISQTQTTPSYTIELDIEPAQMMSMAGSSMGSMASMGSMGGEVMVTMPGMPMPTMATTDQGQPVNHHVEAHIFDRSTGAVDAGVMPAITMTDAMGMTRTLSPIVEMYDPSVGMSDLHFGNNVYLPDGTYTFTVTVGPETATFANVAVSGGAPLQMPSMSPGS